MLKLQLSLVLQDAGASRSSGTGLNGVLCEAADVSRLGHAELVLANPLAVFLGTLKPF